MKTLLNFYAVILLFLFQGSFAQGDGQTKKDVKNDVENDGYKGKVKLVDRGLYKAKEKSGKVIVGERTYTEMAGYNYVYQYNEKGYIIEDITYESSGVERYDFKYTYDERGNIIERLHFNSAGGVLISRITSNFDEKGNEIEQATYGMVGSLMSKYTSKYDEKGNLVEQSEFNAWTLIGKDIDTYDEKGLCIEANRYGASGMLESRLTNRYDEKGNLVETNVFNSDGKLMSRDTHKFDDKGNQVEEVWYDARGKIDWKAYYQYDTLGNQIEIKRALSTGVFTYKFEYDQQGNAIKGFQYRKGSLQAVAITRIEYYP